MLSITAYMIAPKQEVVYPVLAIELLGSIAMLVVGILAVTHPQLGLQLSPAAQWALIGVGGTYTGCLLLGIGELIKFITCTNNYLCCGTPIEVT